MSLWNAFPPLLVSATVTAEHLLSNYISLSVLYQISPAFSAVHIHWWLFVIPLICHDQIDVARSSGKQQVRQNLPRLLRSNLRVRCSSSSCGHVEPGPQNAGVIDANKVGDLKYLIVVLVEGYNSLLTFFSYPFGRSVRAI